LTACIAGIIILIVESLNTRRETRCSGSEEALRVVAELHPVDPTEDGRRAIKGGLGDIFAAACVTAFAGYFGRMMWAEAGWERFFFVALAALMGIGILYIFCRGCFGIADGCSSIRNRTARRDDVGIYYRNGQYTRWSTGSDRLYGHLVTPVDNVVELVSAGIDYVFLNGVTAVNARDTVECSGSDVGDCSHYFEFDCLLDGGKVADGRWPSTKEVSEEWARKVEGKPLWITGPVHGDGCVSIESYGDAIFCEQDKTDKQ